MALSVIFLSGDVESPDFQRARHCAEMLSSQIHSVRVEINELTEIDWIHRLNQMRRKNGAKYLTHAEKDPLFEDRQAGYIGNTESFIRYIAMKFNYHYEDQPAEFYQDLAMQRFVQHLKSTGNEYVYLDFGIGQEQQAFRIIIQLFNQLCPRTCENFRSLCTGERGSSVNDTPLCYRDSPIHRVVPGGWIQGGDIVHGKGDSGESIYGTFFEDESFVVKHDQPAIVGMANQGPHTNNSQFYITLRELDYLNQKKVAFGKVVTGWNTLQMMVSIETQNQRPVIPIFVRDCGQLHFEDGQDAAEIPNEEQDN